MPSARIRETAHAAQTASPTKDEVMAIESRIAQHEPPDFALLVAAGRLQVGVGSVRAFEQAAGCVTDWFEVLQLANTHRMVALVGSRLERLPAALIPADATAAWRLARRANAVEALRATGALARVAAAFAKAGVDALAYKGPALALAAYGDSGARTCVDLDFVVTPSEFRAARRALVSAGLRSRSGMSPAQEAVVFAAQGHAAMAWPSADEPFVELHWRFASERVPWSPPVAEVCARAIRTRIGSTEVLAPCDADQVLLLALHATRHHWEELESLVAFATFLQRATLDSAAVWQRARDVGGCTALRIGAALARRVLGVSVPDGWALAPQAELQVYALAQTVLEHWHRNGAWTEQEESAFEQACLERRRDRLRRGLVRTLYPSMREWEMMRLPALLAPLYLLLRWARLAWRMVPRSVASWRRLIG